MSRDRIPVAQAPPPEGLDGWAELAFSERLFFRLERKRSTDAFSERWILELPDEEIKAEGPTLDAVVESVFRMWLWTNEGEDYRERLAEGLPGEPTAFARAVHEDFEDTMNALTAAVKDARPEDPDG